MNVKHLIAGSMLGFFAVVGGAIAAPLEAGVSSGGIQNPSIRFIEAREQNFQEAVRLNNAPVAAMFRDSQRTTNMATGLSDDLQGIGVGHNSQMARTLCAISSIEVSTRQENLDDVYFHLSKVQGLLAEHDANAGAISSEVSSTYNSDHNAVYQAMHASMETTNCVPASVNATIDQSEAARLAIVQTAR